MGRVIANTNIDDTKEIKDLASKCEIALTDIVSQINGNVEFDKNILTQTVVVTFPATADSQIAINHNLNVIPKGYIICKKSVACDVYDGSTLFDSKQIYLKCTVANAIVTIIIKGS